MTDKYTLEDIRDAFDDLLGPHGRGSNAATMVNFEALLSCLTRPRVEFKEGEVVFCPYLEDDQPTGEWVLYDGSAADWSVCRKQTTAESGAGELIEAMEKTAEECAATWVSDDLRAAVKKWREERGE